MSVSDPSVWFVRHAGVETGPHNGAKLRAMVASGRINDASAIRRAGGPWKPAPDVKGLFDLSEPSPPPSAPPLPEPAAAEPARDAPPPVPPPTPPEAAETIAPHEVAAAMRDAPPISIPGPRSPEYRELRAYGSIFAVLGMIAYVIAGLLCGLGVLLFSLGVWGTFEPELLARAQAQLVFGLAAILYAAVVGVVGLLLRCLGKGVEAFADVAANVAALRR